jgi:hypothetical protein
MNKQILLYGLAALIAFTTMISCNDNPSNTGTIQQDENNNATQIMNNNENGKIQTMASAIYKINTKVGHSASTCNGCVIINGKYVHVDCMGSGNQCSSSGTVKLTLASTESGINYYQGMTLYEYELTTEDYFLFPARSLWVYNEFTGTECWMNIPEQMLNRDKNTNQFTFKGIYFSDKQEFDNE